MSRIHGGLVTVFEGGTLNGERWGIGIGTGVGMLEVAEISPHESQVQFAPP
jgi:hypothetical protein